MHQSGKVSTMSLNEIDDHDLILVDWQVSSKRIAETEIFKKLIRFKNSWAAWYAEAVSEMVAKIFAYQSETISSRHLEIDSAVFLAIMIMILKWFATIDENTVTPLWSRDQ